MTTGIIFYALKSVMDSDPLEYEKNASFWIRTYHFGSGF